MRKYQKRGPTIEREDEIDRRRIGCKCIAYKEGSGTEHWFWAKFEFWMSEKWQNPNILKVKEKWNVPSDYDYDCSRNTVDTVPVDPNCLAIVIIYTS